MTTEAPVEEQAPTVEEPRFSDEVLHLDIPDAGLETLSVSQRKLGLRIIPYGVIAEHPIYGALLFEQGAFGEVDPHRVRLRMDHADPPTGLGSSFKEEPDGAYMDFSVSRTQRGDEQLTLARDGVSRGASIGFRDVIGGPRPETRNGRVVTVYPPNSASLEEVSTTWKPTFAEAGVMYVLNKDEKGAGQVPEIQEASAPEVKINPTTLVDDMRQALAESVNKALSEGQTQTVELMTKFADRIEAMEERQRSNFAVPTGEQKPKAKLSQWAEWAIKSLHSDPASDRLMRELALGDIVTPDNPGAVPDAFVDDLDDLIDDSRPFLQSTREVTAPREGMSITLPKITQRTTMGAQSEEKAEITGSQVLKIGNETYDGVGIAGGADVAEQILRRASSTYFDILMGDFAEAYAYDAETKALDALLTGTSGNVPDDGGTIDPENLEVGGAFQTALANFRRRPDTLWLGSAAVAAFIDAKNNGTNEPLWSVIRANITAGDGGEGPVSGLRVVHVPAIDDTEVDAIIGPSRGFVWAEDGSWRLEAPVPSRVGRDIVLAGLLFPMPRHAAAFTTYTLPSS